MDLREGREEGGVVLLWSLVVEDDSDGRGQRDSFLKKTQPVSVSFGLKR
jgi:hypothetical protein